MLEIRFIRLTEIAWRQKRIISVPVVGAAILVFNQIDNDGVKTAAAPVFEIGFSLRLG